MRAAQSSGSAKPFLRCSPQSAARAAAGARAAPQAFSVLASASATAAHSAPANSAGSKAASSWRSSLANATNRGAMVSFRRTHTLPTEESRPLQLPRVPQ